MFVATCDKIRLSSADGTGKYYSDKTPLLAVAGAAIYFVLHSIGLDVREHLSIIYQLLTFFLVLLPALSIFYFLQLYYLSKTPGPNSSEAQLWTTLAATFGTLILPYSLVFNSHVPAAAALLGSFVLLQSGSLGIAGLLLGLGLSFDPANAFFGIGFFALCFWTYHRSYLRGVLFFGLAAALPLAITMLIYWQVAGSWLPFQMQTANYFYPGSVQKAEYMVGAVSWRALTPSSILSFFWQGTVGFKGVFSHSLALILGFIPMIQNLKSNTKRPETLAILVPITGLCLYFTFDAAHSYGGSCYGWRYMVPWMPLMALFSYDWFDRVGVHLWMKVVIIISVITSSIGMQAPWLFQKWNGTDLKTFDFISAFDEHSVPESARNHFLEPFAAEIQSLQEATDPNSQIRLAELYYQASLPSSALGTLQLLGEKTHTQEWHCYTAILFSEIGVNHPDLMVRHKAMCPPDVWMNLAAKLNLKDLPPK